MSNTHIRKVDARKVVKMVICEWHCGRCYHLSRAEARACVSKRRARNRPIVYAEAA